LTYSDHEFVNFRILSRVTDSAGSEANRQAEYEIEDTVLNLDNDELAMLSWLDAALCVAVSGFTESQDSNGQVQTTAEIGANLSESDYLSQKLTQQRVSTVETDSNMTTEAAVANDEPGLWSVLNAGTVGGYKDLAADGSPYAGNSVPLNDRQRREYYAETMSGPYIDSTDSINVGVYYNRDSMGGEVYAEVSGQMSFVIYEYDQVRAEFGPVPGGISR